MRRNKKIAGIAVASIALAVLFTAIAGVSLQSTIITNTPEDIVPTNVSTSNPITLNIYTPGGEPVQLGITSVDGIAKYVDPSGLNSPIAAICSDTWLSSAGGDVIFDDHVAPAYHSATFTPIRDESGKVIALSAVYHYVVYMTVEAVIRTGPANPIRYTPSITYVSPCNEQIHGSIGLYPYNSEYNGALTRWSKKVPLQPPGNYMYEYKTNTMDSPNYRNSDATGPKPTHPPYATVTTSMVPYTTYTDMVVWSTTQALSSATVAKLKAIAPVAPVKAEAIVNVVGNTQRIQQQNTSFAYTLSDGTAATVKMDTVSAIVGFGMTEPMVPSGTYSGVVPNTNPLHQIPEWDLDDPAFSSQHDPTPDAFSTGSQTTASAGNTVTIEGSIRINNIREDVLLPGTAELLPMPTYTPHFIEYENIENNCGLPAELGVVVSANMGAKQTVQVTTAELKSTLAWVLTPSDLWSTRIDNKYLQWANGMVIDNMMLAQNYTFPVDIVSERAVQFFSSDGQPIDLSTIVDTDVNAIFNDPRVDELYVWDVTPWSGTTGCPFNILDIPGWINCIIHQYAWQIVTALVIVCVIIGLYIFAKIYPLYAKVRVAFSKLKKLR